MYEIVNANNSAVPAKRSNSRYHGNGTRLQERFVLAALANGGDFITAAKIAGCGKSNPWQSAKQLLGSRYVQDRFAQILGTNTQFDRRLLLQHWFELKTSCDNSDDPRDKAIVVKMLENVAKLLGLDQPQADAKTSLEDMIRQYKGERIEPTLPPPMVERDPSPPPTAPGDGTSPSPKATEEEKGDPSEKMGNPTVEEFKKEEKRHYGDS